VEYHVGETQTFARKPVDARRRCPTSPAATVDAEFAVAEIVMAPAPPIRSRNAKGLWLMGRLGVTTKAQFDGVGRLRTYIGFTHSVFS